MPTKRPRDDTSQMSQAPIIGQRTFEKALAVNPDLVDEAFNIAATLDHSETEIEEKQPEQVTMDLEIDLNELSKGLLGNLNPDEELNKDPEIQKLFAIQKKLLKKLNSEKLSKQHEKMEDEVLGKLTEEEIRDIIKEGDFEKLKNILTKEEEEEEEKEKRMLTFGDITNIEDTYENIMKKLTIATLIAIRNVDAMIIAGKTVNDVKQIFEQLVNSDKYNVYEKDIIYTKCEEYSKNEFREKHLAYIIFLISILSSKILLNDEDDSFVINETILDILKDIALKVNIQTAGKKSKKYRKSRKEKKYRKSRKGKKYRKPRKGKTIKRGKKSRRR